MQPNRKEQLVEVIKGVQYVSKDRRKDSIKESRGQSCLVKIREGNEMRETGNGIGETTSSRKEKKRKSGHANQISNLILHPT